MVMQQIAGLFKEAVKVVVGMIFVIGTIVLLFGTVAAIGGVLGAGVVVIYNSIFGASVSVWIGAVCGSIVVLLREL